MPLELPETPDLPAALAALLAQVPLGKATTYGALAEALGDRGAARWVGEYLVDHAHDGDCPCHRVLLRTGEPGKFIAGDGAEKLRRLAAEGVPSEAGRVDLQRHNFAEFVTTRPLAALMEFQRQLPGRVTFEPLVETPELVAAVDVAYGRPGEGSAALAVVETATGRLTDSAQVRSAPRFPYITGYLAFREIALLRDVIERKGELPPVLFVDGNGWLHPRRSGIATTLGVLLDHPTIGVGKKLLCGRVDLEGLRAGERRPVIDGDEVIGMAVRAADGSRPIFISVGNRIDLESAVRLTEALFFGHRLPEPVYHADRLSRAPFPS